MLDIEKIKEVVADYFNMPISCYIEKTRKREYVTTRHVAIYFCSVKMDMLTQREIADLFYLKERSDISYIMKKINGFLNVDRNFCKKIKDIENILANIETHNSKDVINTYILGKSIN